MQFTFKASEISIGSIPKKGSILLAAEKEVGRITVVGNDLVYQTVFPASVIDPGQVSIPEKILDLIATVDGEVMIVADQNTIKVNAKGLEVSMPLNQEEVSVLSGPGDNAKEYEIDKQNWRGLLAVALNEQRGTIPAGILMEVDSDGKLKLVASDGFRLGSLGKVGTDVQKLVIPKKTAELVSGKEFTHFRFNENTVMFLNERETIISRIFSEYPNYAAALPDESKIKGVCKINAAELKAVIKRVKISSSVASPKIQLFFDNNSLVVSSFDTEKASEIKQELEIVLENGDLKNVSAIYAANYVADGLNIVTDEMITVQLAEVQKNKYFLVFQGEGNAYYLVLPVTTV